ncbi:MAG: hypothetical protein GEU90_16370 [Gemmatimonas sp.]|nr:hypothetical protein [Gemmatimonas sp.]
MYSKIVVGVDFSPGGEVLMQSLPELRRLGTKEVTLVHSLDVTYPVDGLVEYEDGYRGHLEVCRRRVESEGFEAEIELTSGSPGKELARVADDRGARLIVVGSRSHSRLVNAFVGSVAWGVLRHTSVPVLVVRIEPGAAAGDQPFETPTPAGFERVVFPTDWSESADRAFKYVERLAHSGVESFLLIHVRDQVEESRTGHTNEEEDRGKLAALEDRLRTIGVAVVEIADPGGAPAQEIVRRAAERPGTLVVMGSHGRTALGDVFLGSVSREVVRTGRTPVLLIPRVK